jgi:hypothetical protein
MGISHVFRGDEHVNNTPLADQHLRALGRRCRVRPLPMILGDDGDKLSKRRGAVSVTAYEEAGYLPEAMLNYLARLGWSHGDDELFSREQMVSGSTARTWQEPGAVGRGQAELGQRALHQAGRRRRWPRLVRAAGARGVTASSAARCRRCARCSRTAAPRWSSWPTGWACTSATVSRAPRTWRRTSPRPCGRRFSAARPLAESTGTRPHDRRAMKETLPLTG